MLLFAHRLALSLGYASVDTMLEGMSWRDLVRWAGYYQIEPWGEERGDLRSGIVAATVANVFRKRKRPFKPADFMPRFQRKAPRRQSSEQIWDTLMLIAKEVNRGH